MSEETTTTPVAESSAPAATESPTASTLDGDVSGEVTAEEVQSAAESSSQSDGTPTTPETETSKTKEESPFSLDSWDGGLESLPESIRTLVTKKQKDLEAGYTPKYQQLAEQRKTFESEASKQKAAWEEKEAQYALYKAMYEGREDPRIAKMKSELEALTKKYETESKDWKSQHELLQKKYVQLEDTQDQAYVEGFRKRHADLLADEAQKAKFMEFAEKGWDLDVAAILPSKDPEIVKLASEFARSGIPHEHALQYAELKINGAPPAPRQPRIGAKITNGATSSTNPARIKAADYNDLSMKDAYLAAAKKAIRS